MGAAAAERRHQAVRRTREEGDRPTRPLPGEAIGAQERERRSTHRRPTRSGDLVRGLTGSMAAGVAVLAVFLTAVQVWVNAQGEFGPGLGAVIGHYLAAAAALTLQAVADRRRDRTGGWCTVGVVVLSLAPLVYWWWF